MVKKKKEKNCIFRCNKMRLVATNNSVTIKQTKWKKTNQKQESMQ